MSIDGLSLLFVRLKMRAGVNTPGRVHRLRHTAALQYLRGAKDSFLLQLFLRHEDLTMGDSLLPRFSCLMLTLSIFAGEHLCQGSQVERITD